MKKLILLSTVILSSCTTYKSDNHSVKYTTNYNTSVTPPSNVGRNNIEPYLPDTVSSSESTEQFRLPEELSLDDVSPLIKSKTLTKKSTVVRSYAEPMRSSHSPMAGVTPFPRDHWRAPAPQIFFYGGY